MNIPKNKLYLLIVSLTLMLVMVFIFINKPIVVDYFLLQEKAFDQTIITVGRVEPGQRVKLAFENSGVVAEKGIREGDYIKAGSLLLALDTEQEKQGLLLRQNQLEQSKIHLNRGLEEEYSLTQEKFNLARLELENNEENLYRLKVLLEAGAISQVQYDEGNRQMEISRAKLNELELRLKSLKPGGIRWEEALGQLKNREIETRSAEISLEKRKLYSPIDGIVSEISKDRGEYVRAGEEVITILNSPSLIKVEIDEREQYKINEGMKVLVSPQTSLQEVFDGVIAAVSPNVNPEKGIVEVLIKLVDEEIFLKPYSAVNVEIILAEEEEALIIPQRFVYWEKSQPFLWIWEDNQIIKEPIMIKKEVDNWFILDKSLSKSYVLDPQSYTPGQKVQLGTIRGE